MATNEKQFFRDIKPGDVSIEGRKSNGITARADGSVILYSGIKENELENLQNYNGTIPTDGFLGNIIAVLKADQEVAYPLGNNNEETYVESAQIDPNKIITTTPKDVIYDPCKNKDIFIVGDSITVDAGYTWSSQYKKKQTDKNVKILAIQGKQLTVWMKPELEKELKTNKYDVVYIYGGVNDAFSGKTTSQILKALQSMVDNIKNNGAQAIVITGYDAEKDMDINKMPITRYVRTADDYKPLLEEYKKFQSIINTITGALIIPKVSVGILNDGFHPNSSQAKILYEHILKNTPKCGDNIINTPQIQAQQPTVTTLPTKEPTPPPPALEYLPEDEELIQSLAQIYEDIDYLRDVNVIDGTLWVATAGYSVKVQALYNNEKSGVSSKNSKQILEAAKSMIDKAIARYPDIADKTKYPDALNRLLALCLVAYNECRFSPSNESANHTYNTAVRAKLKKVKSLTLDEFYNKFGVKAGEESKKASGDAHTSNPEAIFNYAYGNAHGNGDEASGDGFKFRGRCYYGITFKSSYKKVGKELYGDENKFLTNPDSINDEPIATDVFLRAMFEGGLCALGYGLLAYTTTGGNVDVTLPNGTKKKIKGDKASNYAGIGKGANNLVNGNDSPGYTKNYPNIYNSQELKDYINSKLR